MSERRIPEEIKERLRKRLLENVGDEDREAKEGIKERKRLLESDIKARIKEKLNRRLLESEGGMRERIRERIKERLRERIRERLRKRLHESGVDFRERIKERLRRRLLESRGGDIKSTIRERLRRRMLENIADLRGRIRERLRRRMLESRGEFRRSLLENREERAIRLIGVRDSGDLSRRRLAMLEKRNEMLERELRRKTRLLKEAYKVVRRVDEMGGIPRIERAMKLAHDTIVKAGAKLFKESVDMLSAETGVNKKRVAELVKKVGLKEAREILKRKGSKVVNAPKTIVVEGIDNKKEQFPVLATRIAERLSKSVEAGNPGDLKQLSEAVFKKVGE
jgi:hypothetical protein